MAEENGQSGSEQGEGKSEEGVFSKFIKTITFDNSYKNDGKDPGFKTLNAASFDSTAAMSGMKAGTKQTKIKGDSIFHYMKNRFVIVDENDTLYVNGQQACTVKGNAQFLCSSNYLRGVSGNEDIRVNKDRTLIVLGTSEENYLGTHEVTAPSEFEWKSFERGFSFTKLDLMALGFDFHGAEITAKGADVDVGIDNAEGSAFHQEIKLTHEKEELFHTKVGFEADVLLRVDSLLDVGLGTPFR